MASRKVMRTSEEIDSAIQDMQKRIKELKKEQRIRKKQEEAENARLKREAELKEAHDLIQIAKSLSVTIEGQSVTVYDWLKRESLRGQSSLKSEG